MKFIDNLDPPSKARALRRRNQKYDIALIKIGGALLISIGARSEKSLKNTLYVAVKNYRKTNPAANFTIAHYDTPAGVANIGVFRLADTAPTLQVAAE